MAISNIFIPQICFHSIVRCLFGIYSDIFFSFYICCSTFIHRHKCWLSWLLLLFPDIIEICQTTINKQINCHPILISVECSFIGWRDDGDVKRLNVEIGMEYDVLENHRTHSMDRIIFVESVCNWRTMCTSYVHSSSGIFTWRTKNISIFTQNGIKYRK